MTMKEIMNNELNVPSTSYHQMGKNKKGIGIRNRILIGFLLMAIITIVSVTLTLVITTNAENFSKRIVENDFPLYDALIDFNTELYKSKVAIQSLIMTRDEAYKKELNNSLELLKDKKEELNRLIALSGRDNFIEIWSGIKNSSEELKDNQMKVLDAINRNDIPLATQILNEKISPLVKTIANSLNQTNLQDNHSVGLLDMQLSILQKGASHIVSDISQLRLMEYIILGVSIIFSIMIALITAKKIIRPLGSAIDIAKEIASGNRGVDIQITSNDETGDLLSALKVMQLSIKESEMKLQESEEHTRQLFESVVRSAKMYSEHSGKVSAGDLRQRLDISGSNDQSNQEVMNQLGSDLNKMTDNLSSVAKEITQACHSMVTTLDEVRHAVDSQSSGASEQASSINEITASVSEIEKSTSQTMEKAKALGNVAERTRERGQLGLEAVEQSVQGMKAVRDKVQIIAQTILDLSNQTQQVGEITAVVNNLAQQSKMLALNASIEAAKAGESGKGFAVVASEVKNLAEQSEQSTDQVQKILEDIKRATEKAVMATEEGTKGVDHGTGLVEQTGDIIRGLNDVIHETTIASQQIEAAIRQESAGIEQITAGMNEINQVTSSFVESVKQTTEAMANLSKVAKNLQVYVDTYKV